VRVLTDRHPKLEIEILATARQFRLLKREADIALVTGVAAAVEAAVRERAAVVYDSRSQTQTVI
jgi:DNA-binding transcriptional LysR family regulator